MYCKDAGCGLDTHHISCWVVSQWWGSLVRKKTWRHISSHSFGQKLRPSKNVGQRFCVCGMFLIIYLLVGCLILMINQSVFIAAIEPSVIFLLCSIVNNWALPKKWAREYCGCRVSRIIYLGDLSPRETLMRTNDFARMNSAVPQGLTRFQDF